MTHSLLERLQTDGVTQLWVIYHDYSGVAHAKTIPPERFANAVASGIGFAKPNMDFNILDHQVPSPIFTAETGDFLAVPDPATYALLPYHPGAARTFSFLTVPGGERWPGCPRTALQRVADAYATTLLSRLQGERAGPAVAAGTGGPVSHGLGVRDLRTQLEGRMVKSLRVRAALEPECYLFVRGDHGYVPADQSRMFTVDGLERHSALLSRLMETLGAMGVTVEQIGAEYGPGQYEVNVRHSEPLAAADNLLTFKDAFRALAREAGLLVSFMPKPYTELPGCGLHIHLGLEDEQGRNVMDGTTLGDGDATGLSALGRAFIGGLLAHAPALCGVGAPSVNSYKRLLPGSWSPAHICYGPGNRAALVRIPGAGARHVELRAGDNTCNPHLFLAAVLAAGLDGIRRNLDPGAPIMDDIGRLSPQEAAERGLALLPRSAPEALDALEADATIMEALGPLIGPTFLRVKRSEAAAYAVEVSEWERAAYLETV